MRRAIIQALQVVVPRRRFDALLPQRLLCLANIRSGELGADTPSNILRLAGGQVTRGGLLLHRLPDGHRGPGAQLDFQRRWSSRQLQDCGGGCGGAPSC